MNATKTLLFSVAIDDPLPASFEANYSPQSCALSASERIAATPLVPEANQRAKVARR